MVNATQITGLRDEKMHDLRNKLPSQENVQCTAHNQWGMSWIYYELSLPVYGQLLHPEPEQKIFRNEKQTNHLLYEKYMQQAEKHS